MRSLTGFSVWCVLCVGGLASAADMATTPVSEKAVSTPRLSKMMPGRLVVQGSQGHKLYYAFARGADWTMWDEFTVDPPADSPLGWGGPSVGTGVHNLVVGGVQKNAAQDPTHPPIWYRDGQRWARAILQGTPTANVRERRVQALAYGDPQGTKMYAFGWENAPQPRAAIWESTDSGVHWSHLLRRELAGHQWAWGQCANADGVVYGYTDKSMIRLSADGHSVGWLPPEKHGILSLAAPNRFEVTVVLGEPASTKPHAGIFAPPALPTLHVYFSNNSTVNWTKLGQLHGDPTGAEFLGKYIGVVACQTEKPYPEARLIYTRDGCQSWHEDTIRGAQVEGIKIVNTAEIYLLLRSLGSERLFYAKWKPTW